MRLTDKCLWGGSADHCTLAAALGYAHLLWPKMQGCKPDLMKMKTLLTATMTLTALVGLNMNWTQALMWVCLVVHDTGV